MEQFDIDAYAPKQMAARVEKAGVTKGSMDFFSTLVLAKMAGAFIGFGSALYIYVIHDSTLSLGLTKLIGGLVFCLGLILVVVAGAELFTGNNLIVMAYVSRKVSLSQLFRNWGIVFTGNLIGSLTIVLLIFLSGHWMAGGAAVGAKTLLIANEKVNLSLCQTFSRGILCNMLVCLAVWLCFSGRSVTDKILAIIFPVMAFVTLGFEHSVANMYFIPAGLLVKHNPVIVARAQTMLGAVPLDLSRLTISGFLLNNLLPVTIGNIIGGSLLVAAIYWFVYLRGSAAEPVRRCMTGGPPTVAPHTSIAEAARVMGEHASGSVLVGETGKALGILSEKDIVHKVIAAGRDPAAVTVDQVMSTPLISVDIRASAYEVYRTMAKHQIRHLLVTREGQQVGFVSVRDILKNPII
ncbi:MAG: formate/nitrite family transporter [bacterium]